MKKLSKLKLNQLSSSELNERELSLLLGGAGNCCCGCNGPSSTSANSSANNAKDLSSPGCGSGNGYEWMRVNTTVYECDAPAGCNSTNGCNNNYSCPK